MAVSNFRKETAVPGAFAPNELVFVARADHPDLMDAFMANAAGDALRSTLRREHVEAMIDAAIAAGSGGGVIVDDISARNAITSPADMLMVYVVDASADALVESGGAFYMYRASTTAWIKISEAESLDMALVWEAVTGRPASTPAQIDAAVTNSHSHANKTQLDQIGQDGDGNLTYNGALPKAALSSTAW